MADRLPFNPLSRLFASGRCHFLPEHTTAGDKPDEELPTAIRDLFK